MADLPRKPRRDDDQGKPARSSGRPPMRAPNRGSGRSTSGRPASGRSTGRPDMRGAGKGRPESRGASASGGPKPRSGGGRARPEPRAGTGRARPESGSGTGRSGTGKPDARGRTGGRPVARGTGGRGRPEARGGRGRSEGVRGRSSGPPGARAGGGRGRPQSSGNKRTSRNTDDRNPTRSGIQYPSPRYRSREATPEPAAAKERPALRRVRRSGGDASAPVKASKRPRKAAPTRRRPVRSTEASVELKRVAGRGASRALQELERAAEAFNAGHERDAMRLLRPLREAYPEVAAVRELLGLCHYRLGQFPAAARELGHFADLTGSVDQHPVLMDCARSQRKYPRVESLWDELAAASPAAALVTEGRIVLAGSLADRGRLREAIALLERRGNGVQRVSDHHLRLWYTLADLCERSGDLPRARELFDRVRKRDAAFSDVAERLVALS